MLQLIAANRENAFAEFTYGIASVFVLLFERLTATPSAGGFVLEINSWAVARTIWVMFHRPRGNAWRHRASPPRPRPRFPAPAQVQPGHRRQALKIGDRPAGSLPPPLVPLTGVPE